MVERKKKMEDRIKNLVMRSQHYAFFYKLQNCDWLLSEHFKVMVLSLKNQMGLWGLAK